MYTYAGNLVNWCHRKVDELKSFKEQLPLYETAAILPLAEPAVTKSVPVGNKVFVVHGHDESAKHQIARFLENLDLDPIILGEKSGQGRVLIEKLEQESGINVGYAVVLLTPDDEGKSRHQDELKPRARQNVILELGYFIGKLGRSRVCPLTVADVEIPSDYHGVEYIPLDTAGGWKLRLANELEAAGYSIDRSKLK
jgi:predicted nucleotide-binding protein